MGTLRLDPRPGSHDAFGRLVTTLSMAASEQTCRDLLEIYDCGGGEYAATLFRECAKRARDEVLRGEIHA